MFRPMQARCITRQKSGWGSLRSYTVRRMLRHSFRHYGLARLRHSEPQRHSFWIS